MLGKNKAKTEYITHSDLAKQTKIILGAIDSRFNGVDKHLDGVDKRLDGIDKRLDDTRKELYIIRNELKADIKNTENSLREEIYIVRDELKTDIHNTQALIDGGVKSQEDSKQEFVIVKAEVKQMKQVFKQKLGVEIRAV